MPSITQIAFHSHIDKRNAFISKYRIIPTKGALAASLCEHFQLKNREKAQKAHQDESLPIWEVAFRKGKLEGFDFEKALDPKIGLRSLYALDMAFSIQEFLPHGEHQEKIDAMLEFLLRKFEITKKIKASYARERSDATISNSALLLSLFGVNLVHSLRRRFNLKFLNTLLKVNDLLLKKGRMSSAGLVLSLVSIKGEVQLVEQLSPLRETATLSEPIWQTE